MKLNKINKLFVLLSFIAIIFADIAASRPLIPTTNPTGTASYSRLAGRKPLLGRPGFGRRRPARLQGKRGVICKRMGCRKVNVTGAPVTGRKHNAVVCRGNACRRATVRKHQGSRGRVPGRRGYGR